MSLMEELGFEPETRVVVVHVDDLGMCEAASRGGLQALEGAAPCGSPPETRERLRANSTDPILSGRANPGLVLPLRRTTP